MDKEGQPEEAILLDWTTAVEALDFSTIQELYKENPDLLWTPLQLSSHLESDFAHFIDRLKKFEILGDNIRPLFALHHILIDYGLPEDEWAAERSELVDFFLEASTALQLNNFFWGSEQNTVLHLAYFIQQPNLVKKLLEKGALPTIPNKSGHLPEQKMDPVITGEGEEELQAEDSQPKLLKTNKLASQKDERKPQIVSDRFKRLRELAESPNLKKPLTERQNSTRKYFRPGHIEERKRKVLTEEEIELEKQKQRRQKEVELLAQRSAVKNNPLFKKFEQQQPTTTPKKQTGPSGNVASAIKSRQALLDAEQSRRNSRVISSLKDRSVVSTSVFRQQQQSKSLKVPTLDELRAASPTFKKSSLNETIAESDSEDEEEEAESVENVKTESIPESVNKNNDVDPLATKDESDTDNMKLKEEKSPSEVNNKPKTNVDVDSSKNSTLNELNTSDIEPVQKSKDVGKIGKPGIEETVDTKSETPLRVGKLKALNLSPETTTKQKKFSGILVNKVKNIVDVHEHLNDKEDVEIDVLGKKFAVWRNNASGYESEEGDDDSLPKSKTATTTDTPAKLDKTTNLIEKNDITVSSSSSSSSSSFSSENQSRVEKEVSAPKSPKISIASETEDDNSNIPTSNFVSTTTASTFKDDETYSEKSGDYSNLLKSDSHKTAETNDLDTSTVSASAKQIDQSFSSLSEESLVDSLLVGNRDSTSNSFLNSQAFASRESTKNQDTSIKDHYDTIDDNSSVANKKAGYNSDTQNTHLSSNKVNSKSFRSDSDASNAASRATQGFNVASGTESKSTLASQNNVDVYNTDRTLALGNKSTLISQTTIETGSQNSDSSFSYRNELASTSKNNASTNHGDFSGKFIPQDSFIPASQNTAKSSLSHVSTENYRNDSSNYAYRENNIMSDEEDFVDPHIQQFMKNNSSKTEYNNNSGKLDSVNVELANGRKQPQGSYINEAESYFEDSDEDEATTPTMATFKKFEFSNSQQTSIQNSNSDNQPRSMATHNQTKSPSDPNWETAYNDLLSSKEIDFEDDIVDNQSDSSHLYSSRTSFSSDVDEKNIIDKLSTNNLNSFNGNRNESNSKSNINNANTENEENPQHTQLVAENQTKNGKSQTDSLLNPSRPDSEAVEYSVNKVQITEMYPSTSSAVITSDENKRASGSQRKHWSNGMNLMDAVLKRESMRLDRQSIAASSEAGSEQWFDPDDDWASQDDTYRKSLMSTSTENYHESSQKHNDMDDSMSAYYEEKPESTTAVTNNQKNEANNKEDSDYYYNQSRNSEDSYRHNQSPNATPRSEYFNHVSRNRTSDSSTASESSSYKNSNSTQNTAHEDYDYKTSYNDDNEETMDYYATKLHTDSSTVNERMLDQHHIEYTQQQAHRSQFQIDSDNEEGEGEIVVFMDQTHSNNRVRPDSDYNIDGKLGRMEFQSMVSTEEFKTIDIQNTAPSSQGHKLDSREVLSTESQYTPPSPQKSRFTSDSTYSNKVKDQANLSEENGNAESETESTSKTKVINDNSSNKFELPDEDDTPPVPHDPNIPRVEDISRYMNTLPAVENAYVEHDNKKHRISKKPSSDEQGGGDRGIPNAHEINFDVLPDSFKDIQSSNDASPRKISVSSTEASSYGKMYIGVSGAHNMLLPLPKEITYVRCVISDGEYEYMSRYEILGPQILMDYECIVDTRPGMIVTVSLHVRPDYHVKPRTGWSKWFTSIRKQKEHLSGYVHPEDGAIGQTRFAVDHMVPACHKKTYEANFDCFNSWYARTNRERARREQYGDEEDFLKIVGKLTVEMLYLPVSSPSVQVPRSLRECDLTLKIRQWHSTCWHSGYLSTRCQGLKIWERRYYRLIGSQLIGYNSELDEVENQVWDRYNIADVIRLSAAADKVIISLVEEEDPDKIFKPESIHDENNKGFFRLSFSDFYLDCVSDDANESEEWVKTLKSMIGRVPLRLPFTD